jgi:hypothetical protein
MRDPWERLHAVLMHMTDKLTDKEDGERKIFRDSLIDNYFTIKIIRLGISVLLRENIIVVNR